MITATPGQTVEAVTDNWPTGLVGTLAYRVIDNVGGTFIARTTAGVVERVTVGTKGVYVVTFVAPTTLGQYTIVWDDGTQQASEDLVVQADKVVTTEAGAWTYDPSTLATSTRNQVRLEIQDTDADNPLLVDAEIDRAIAVEANFWGAAARCCELISRLFLRKADVSLGRSMKVEYSKMAGQYAEMAATLRTKAIGANLPYVGGRKLSEKEDLAGDSTQVQPIFTKEMDKNPRVASRDPEWED